MARRGIGNIAVRAQPPKIDVFIRPVLIANIDLDGLIGDKVIYIHQCLYIFIILGLGHVVCRYKRHHGVIVGGVPFLHLSQFLQQIQIFRVDPMPIRQVVLVYSFSDIVNAPILAVDKSNTRPVGGLVQPQFHYQILRQPVPQTRPLKIAACVTQDETLEGVRIRVAE